MTGVARAEPGQPRSGRSIASPSRGQISATPNTANTATATARTVPEARPTPSITVASATTASVWHATSPSAIPAGRRRPPVALADSSAGSTGSTQA